MAEVSGKPTKFQATAKATDLDRVWSLWTDVDSWPTWDLGLTKASIDGPMTIGARGTIVGQNNRASRFEVIKIDPGKSFVFAIRLPGGRMILIREIDEENITHRVMFTGISKSIFGALVGRPNMELIGPSVDAVIELAERKTI